MEKTEGGKDFIRTAVAEHNENGRFKGRVQTRFPPEPNGYLHIGHAKAFHTDFAIAAENQGFCGLRFDDTNPEKEDTEYVEAIKEDIRWMGYDWGDHEYYASDYFEQLYALAQKLIGDGKAYVDEQKAEELAKNRGTATSPGVDSPWRDRPVEESLDLLERMRHGEFPDGAMVLRAKIDMAHSNMLMRDPLMYRIRHAAHHRTGTDWKIYPLYDWAHGQSDAIEGVTHSFCTLEFDTHRPLYDWYCEACGFEEPPQQIEFARLNLTHTLMSKRKLRYLVEEGLVSGWDDPRMPTLKGMRRRGYPASAIRQFIAGTGLSRTNSMNELGHLEHYVREELNASTQRAMVIQNPLKVVVTNYPEDQVEYFPTSNNPQDESKGTREVPFSRELWIDREDFKIEPPRKYFRLFPGNEVRFMSAYFLKCTGYETDSEGNVTEVHCTYDPESRGGNATDGRKVKGTLTWLSAAHAKKVELRNYDVLLTAEDPGKIPSDEPIENYINPESLVVNGQAYAEPWLAEAPAETAYQFLRVGYFVADRNDHSPAHPVFNRIVPLKDGWAKASKK